MIGVTFSNSNQRFRLNVSINLEVHQVQSCLKLLSSLPGSSTKIFPFDPFAVLLESILRFLPDRQRILKDEGTKKPGPSVRLTHSRRREKNLRDREPGYAGLCSLRTHTSSKAFLKGKLCFFPFSILEFDTFGCIVSIPRDRAKADAL